jgi:F0F1-type ATP synthase membrane subunit b/b'
MDPTDLEFIKWVDQEKGIFRKDIQNILTTVTNLRKEFGEAMGDLAGRVNAATLQIEELKAQNQKALSEIKGKLSELGDVQITPEELQAAIDKAKADAGAEFQAQVDAAFAPLTTKIEEAKAVSQELDDLVADVPPPPPPAEPLPEASRRRR